MATWAACPLNFELDILEIRLGVLDPVVDHFVISEAPVTHAGQEKPLHFQANPDRFKRWASKITYVVDESPPHDVWARERHQRSLLSTAIEAKSDDLVLISDVDEVPDPIFWKRARDRTRDGSVATPRLTMHTLGLRWRWSETWPGKARFVSGSSFNEYFGGDADMLASTYDLDVEALWRGEQGTTYGPPVPPSMGWHFAYMGGVEAVQQKLRANAHRQFDRPPFNQAAHIKGCMLTGADLLGRAERRSFPAPQRDLPPYVLANWPRFKHLW